MSKLKIGLVIIIVFYVNKQQTYGYNKISVPLSIKTNRLTHSLKLLGASKFSLDAAKIGATLAATRSVSTISRAIMHGLTACSNKICTLMSKAWLPAKCGALLNGFPSVLKFKTPPVFNVF